MSDATQSNARTQTPADPEPQKENIKNPFHGMVGALRDALTAGPLAPNASNPIHDILFGNHIDAHLVAQQGILAQRCEMLVQSDYRDYRAASIMQRSLALIDRIRARVIKTKQIDARYELDKLKALCSSSQPDRHEAREFLQLELAKGPRPAKELLALAESLGISARTLNRAKSELGIATMRHQSEKSHEWTWSLSASTSSSALSTENSALSSGTQHSELGSMSNESRLPKSWQP